MVPPLLQTKLFLPVVRPGLVPRQRLLQKLGPARGPGSRIILISAPAGFGKTTLAVQWIQTLKRPVGWLSLDESDNLPSRFYSYLGAALEKISPTAARYALEAIDPSNPDGEDIVARFANALAAFGDPFLLVLDDYYSIHDPGIHRAVQSLLDGLPPNGCLMLLSREDPPLPLARRRGRGELVELRQDDLRFTPEEAAEFLNAMMGLDLAGGQVETLETRTEGWIAGLQMAALAMQSSEDRAVFIQAFSGSHRFILDYLVEEVLCRQPEEIQQFLLRTAVLEKMCAGLCDDLFFMDREPRTENRKVQEERFSVGGLPEIDSRFSTSQSTLTFLDSSNLFLVPLDDRREWYRYHHLFADLLRMRLKATHPELIPELHRRASLWFEAHADPKSALDHALAGQDFSRAADLLESHIVSRWREVDMEFFLAVHQIPLTILHERPSLCLHSAWMYVITGQTQRVLSLVEAAEAKIQPLLAHGPTREMIGLAAFARVLRAYLDDFANRSIELDEGFGNAIDVVPEEDVGMRNSIAVVLGSIYYMEGDFSTADRYFADALERDKAANGTNAIPIAATRLARMLIIQGKLHEAMRLCQQNEAYVRERGARRYYIAGNLNIFCANILREWDQLDAAEGQVRQGILLNERWPTPQAQLIGLTALARIQLARGDLGSAAATLERGLEIHQKAQIHPDFLAGFQAARVRLWCARMDTIALERWIEAEGGWNEILQTGVPLIFRHEIRALNLARAFLALGKEQEATRLLQPLAAAAEEGGRTGHLIEIHCLLAACLPPAEALPYLERALRLGESQGFRQVFYELGERLAPVMAQLSRQLERGPENARLLSYLQVLRRRQSPGQPTKTPPGQPGLVEPLSERELEVLRLVEKGLTNQQIADRLVISVRTVKKHLENTYSKLGVESRVQALARAREMSLL